MLITNISENLPPQYDGWEGQEPPKGSTYKDGRGLIFTENNESEWRYIDFDPFAYLRQRSLQEPDRQLEVLEGGCGMAQALRELKNGTGRGWPRVEYEGLGDKIRTTGVTLESKHAEFAERAGVDELFIGPVSNISPDRKYDFIYDYCGAAYYYPEETLPVYGRVLRPGCLAFLRLLVPPTVEDIRQLANQSELTIQKIGGTAAHDLLLTPLIPAQQE